MFDLGFSELVVIAVVLLVVVGPERLPGVARTAGHLFGRMQRYITDVKADIRREMQLDELKKLQEQTRALEQSLREGVGAIQSDVQEALSLPEAEVGGDIGTQDGEQEPQSVQESDAPILAAIVPDAPAKPVDSV
ncbi:MAG: Sec-independent protein translocase protein TatB [Betaproteobacteria bacterium]|nr:Sec-independent protein translocase protein TatB [Betaproteobacteria bacterium]